MVLVRLSSYPLNARVTYGMRQLADHLISVDQGDPSTPDIGASGPHKDNLTGPLLNSGLRTASFPKQKVLRPVEYAPIKSCLFERLSKGGEAHRHCYRSGFHVL
jgi:hypothetical protein